MTFKTGNGITVRGERWIALKLLREGTPVKARDESGKWYRLRLEGNKRIIAIEQVEGEKT